MRDLFGNPISTAETRRISFQQWQTREGNVLYRAGVRQMSNTHLLAHLLREPHTAERLMDRFGDFHAMADASVVELSRTSGVGPAIAEMIQTAFELGRRLSQPVADKKHTVYCPQDIYRLLKDEFDGLNQEHLKVLMLSTKHHVQWIETVFVGTLNCSVIHPREIFRTAIRHSAAAIVLAHNHPSGVTEPSAEDMTATRQMVRAGQLVGISVIDHVIVGDGGYVSFKERGLI